MSRFHLYRVAEGYLLDLQTDYLDAYQTRVVAPVIALRDFDTPAAGLNPLIDVQGETFVVQMHLMAAVPVSVLRTPAQDLSAQADEFTRALDLLFQGY